ncbi:DsbA family protein [Xenophilus sp. Marseille-Q4582]|uniref:DsbA family protein n=1 Tax=Xenophilus sp. Marseille-Q4582 TaxID=2866600 RepID=UPI001CE41CBF|nr:DsbA family protein [Xenophilus sp. Marseille-Q4582]
METTSAAALTLHYLYDPLCGWCYAAAPLVRAARGLPGLQLQAHGGGMLAGANRRPVTPAWREYVLPHDRRIAELSGQPFGEAYFEGLLRDTGAVLDSAPPLTAVLAADAVAGRGLDMIERVQRAHYVEGRRIADPAVLRALAEELGLPAVAFAEALQRLAGAATQAHIGDSRRWLARAQGSGFPTFAIQDTGGALEVLDTGHWLGRPAAWRVHLQGRIERAQARASSAPSPPGRAPVSPASTAAACDERGCAL